MHRGLGWAWAALLGALACGDAERPPRIADPPSRPPEPGSLVDPDEPPAVPGPISTCGAATVQLDFVRPNLYFAIDASGSMSDAIPAGQLAEAGAFPPPNRYVALSRAIEGLLARVGHRVNYGATLFPSLDLACDSGEEVGALQPGDDVSFAVSGEKGPKLRSFMFNINRRAPVGATPVALALEGLLPRLASTGLETYLFLLTDGGPNCSQLTSCGPERCIPNIERARISEQLVCEGELNCCDGSLFGPENCLDVDGSLEAVRALADAGVRTFVIGIPGSEAYADLLDQLALAGGTARGESPRYYRAADAEELTRTVSALGGAVALGCTIQLREPPPDPSLVNLFFDGQLIASDPVDGWTFSDEVTVQVQGEACALLEAGEVLQADLIAGCPIVLR